MIAYKHASRFMRDSMVNFVSMLGTSRDKSTANEFALNFLDDSQLEYAYRGDWVARKVVNVPAGDSTRAWRTWQADKDDIEKIEALEKELGVQHKLKHALIRARLWGGGGLIMGFGDDPSQPIDPEKIKKGGLKYLHVFSKSDLTAGDIERDIHSEYFGLPMFYDLNAGLAGGVTTTGTRIHRSRIVRLVGGELPSMSSVVSSGAQGWGDSVLQPIYDAVMNVASSTQGVAALIQESKIDVVKIPQMMANMGNAEYRSRLVERFSTANLAKSMLSTLILDKEEEWQRITTSFTALPDLMKLYLLIASGAADIPATRLLGQSAQGLNATGEGDIRNYYDHIASEQTTVLSPALTILDQAIVRSALGDAKSSDIYYQWTPLWQMTEKEKAELFKIKVDSVKVISDTGLVEPEVLKVGLENMLIEDGTIPGIESAIEDFEESGGGVDEDDPEVQSQFEEMTGNKPANENAEESSKKAVGDSRSRRRRKRTRVAVDAAPRTLYVRRDLLNAGEVHAHFSRQLSSEARGLLMDPSKWHVTVVYSKTPVDWIKVGEDWYQDENGNLTVVAGGARFMERLGDGGAVVLQFASAKLSSRHMWAREEGCSFDYDEYQPHVTVAWDSEVRIDHTKLEPWRGELRFGPEIFEEIDENWRDKVS